MKYLPAIILFLSFACCGLAQTSQGVNLAVLDLNVSFEIPENRKLILSDRLRSELMNTGRFVVMSRQTMEEILSVQGYSSRDCTTDECLVMLGHLLGVDRMVAGSVAQAGESHSISLRMLDVKSGEILAAEDFHCTCTFDEVLSNRIRLAARQISGEDSGMAAGRRQASLLVYGAPLEANVFLDDRPVGTAAAAIRNLPEGEHTVLLKMPGYFDLKQKVKLYAGEETRLEAFMTKAATLTVTSSPEGADVIVEGKVDRKAVTPATIDDLPSGKYNVKVSLPLREVWEETVFLSSGGRKSLHAELGPVQREIFIKTTVFRGILTINGISSKQEFPCTIKNLERGKYDIEVSAEDHIPIQKTVIVKGDGQIVVDAPIEKYRGVLALSHLPAGVDVYIDRVLIGAAPLQDREIDVGEYLVEFRRLGFESGKERKVEVRRYDVVQVLYDLQPKTTEKAFNQSMKWPGLGQLYVDRRKPGMIFAVSEAVVVAYFLYSSIDYREKTKAYTNADDYYGSTIQSEELSRAYADKLNVYDRARASQLNLNITLAVAGGLYVLNLIDAYMFNDDALNRSISTQRQTQNARISAFSLKDSQGKPQFGMGVSVFFGGTGGRR